jgi:hypothetical protein
VSDIDTVVADSLKVLDPKRPIREADVPTKAQNPPLLTVSVEKGASLRSLQNCQNTNDIFD